MDFVYSSHTFLLEKCSCSPLSHALCNQVSFKVILHYFPPSFKERNSIVDTVEMGKKYLLVAVRKRDHHHHHCCHQCCRVSFMPALIRLRVLMLILAVFSLIFIYFLCLLSLLGKVCSSLTSKKKALKRRNSLLSGTF